MKDRNDDSKTMAELRKKDNVLELMFKKERDKGRPDMWYSAFK